MCARAHSRNHLKLREKVCRVNPIFMRRGVTSRTGGSCPMARAPAPGELHLATRPSGRFPGAPSPAIPPGGHRRAAPAPPRHAEGVPPARRGRFASARAGRCPHLLAGRSYREQLAPNAAPGLWSDGAPAPITPRAVQGRQWRKLAISRRPVFWLFSGWNWVPARLSRPTIAVIAPPWSVRASTWAGFSATRW